MSDYLFSAILLVSSFVFGWVLYFFVAILLKRSDGFFSKGLKIDVRPLKSPLRFLIPALCASVVIPLLRLPEKASLFVGHFIYILLITLFGWVAVKIVYILRDAFLGRYDINVRDNMHARSMHTQ
ncbi:MAG: hypothetical protein COV72_03020, partial [Candidatus Omnitrophica bacterium CG11_big_fil_rev_8_21_14_0_20_42_13]